eukprot:gb/GECG01006043.1/.p1 GENE.gb/GECG01006043.1/~~gb/GECG01006043.1/.p1  ORF type:complete len:174 (+),score=19.75 gb/GECG01006043.1/:1-522(+)
MMRSMTNKGLMAAIGCLLVVTLFVSPCVEAKSRDPKHCEVCKKVLADISDRAENSKDHESIENTIKRYCDGTKKESREKKLCYYIEPVQREVSKPLSMGVPVERVCEKISKRTPEVCELRFPEKIDLKNTDFSKLRVKQLKSILSEHGVTCDGCIEKDDFVRKARELAGKSEL